MLRPRTNARQRSKICWRRKLTGARVSTGTSQLSRPRIRRQNGDTLRSARTFYERYDTALAENAAARAAFERQATEAASALERVGRERVEDAAAAAGQIAGIEAELGARLAEAAVARTALEHTLTDTQFAQQQAVEDLASAAAREVALEARLAQATDRGLGLERQVSDAETARQEAERRYTAELTSAAAGLAALQVRYDVALAESAAARAAFERQAAAAASALERVSRERVEDAAAAAAQIAGIEAELGARIAEATVARSTLEHRLADARSVQQQALDDLASAAARELALDDRLAQETDRGLGLERQLAAANNARQEADRRHTSELADAAAQLASLQARYDAAATDYAAAQATLEQRLAAAATEHQQAAEHTAAALAAASMREAELVERLARECDARQAADRRHASALMDATAQLVSLQARYDAAATDHAAAQATLEQRLAAAATAHQHAQDRTAETLAAASAREAELVGQLTKESDARAALERNFTWARMDSARRRDRSLDVISTHRRRRREEKARFEAQLTSERTAADRELRAQDEEIRQLQREQETLQRLLGTTQGELQDLHRTLEEERQAHERARAASESELHRVSAEYSQIHQSFDRLQSAFQTLEQVAGEHAAERARLEAVVAARDRQLSAQAERHRGAEQDAQDALAAIQETLQQARDAGESETARLLGETDAVRRELDAARIHAEALRGVAERVPDLQAQLERSQNEARRQFERAPYAMCRCSQNGAITDANHSFVTLLGCRRVDDLRTTDFVAAALDSAGDLGWLLERARTTRKTETVETQWTARDGRRLVVRLQALATTSGSIDIVVEDISAVRALEERLRQAQRMEAVGRLASEVAVTCDALLGDVALGAHEWLATVGSDGALRRHAERVLTDVTRAASVLRQLGMYGHEQERALQPVSAQRVLRELAPVLQRLVGNQIALVLPKSAGSFEVDVEAERLERVLINVAGYARERMPSGGQVRIELATTAVGRRFVARYSNVRPGNHVLITVTELPAVGEFRGDSEVRSRSADRPGVDLGVLVDLIASCGGHLWLEAQPAGNMVLKIHLPKPPAATATGSSGARASKWFRSASAATVRA